MKLTKKAKIAILKGKVAKLKFQLKQAREELALQDLQLDKFRTANQDLPPTESGEKQKGIVSYRHGILVLYSIPSIDGFLNLSQDKSKAVTYDSLEEFYSAYPDAVRCPEYKFEPIESGENN
jgi:hypothetical protein